MGMMTLSAAFMKFAAEQRATMRDVRGSILNFAIAGSGAREAVGAGLAIVNDHRVVRIRSDPRPVARESGESARKKRRVFRSRMAKFPNLLAVVEPGVLRRRAVRAQ